MVRTGAVNVGGRQLAVGVLLRSGGCGDDVRCWFGGAEYQVGEIEKAVDTVFLGVFDRRAGDELGGLMSPLFEIRIVGSSAASGGLVWFDPDLSSYHAIVAERVARQY